MATNGQRNQPEWEDFVHTGPGTLAGRFMRRFWHPIYRSASLLAGRGVPIRIMSEDFTLYRGESGVPHLLAFRCAHRGTQLSTGWVEGDTLRCFYHGWVYGPDGQCLEQPAEPVPFCQRIKIRSYPTQEYLGLVFAYLGAEESPVLPRYPEFESGDTLRVTAYIRECNFFNNIENGVDWAHVPFTHRGTLGNYAAGDLGGVGARENAYGVVTARELGDRRLSLLEFGMPNVLLRREVRRSFHALAWRVPIDDESHYSFNLDLQVGDESTSHPPRMVNVPGRHAPSAQIRAILAGELSIDTTEDRSEIVNLQDSVAQIGQGVIPDRQSERLGHSDLPIIAVRNVWVRELRALAEGRPLKQWTRADEPLVAAR